MQLWSQRMRMMLKIGYSLRFIKITGILDCFYNLIIEIEYHIMETDKIDLKLQHKSNHHIYKISPKTSLSSLKTSLSKIFFIPKTQLSLSYLNNSNQKIVIDENDNDGRSLEELGIVGVKVRNIGKQVPWDFVFYVEYFGPIIGVGLGYWFGRREKYQLVHHMAAIMGITHFLKRQLQTHFIHIFSRKTMPLKRLFINSAHYWILFGFLNSIQLFLFPKALNWDSNHLMILFIIWMFMEFCNFQCHLELSSFRKEDLRKRGIPKNWGFRYVSCANYLWESLGWVTFSVMTRCYSSYVFTAVSIAQMASWALKKHKAYKKQFGQEYPKQRKAMIPFIL